jgi:hypothetical protein
LISQERDSKEDERNSNQIPFGEDDIDLSFEIPISFFLIRVEASQQFLNISLVPKPPRILKMKLSTKKEKKKPLFQQSYLIKDIKENFEKVKKFVSEKLSTFGDSSFDEIKPMWEKIENYYTSINIDL